MAFVSRYHEGELLSVNLTPPLPSISVTGNRPKRAGGSFAYYHQDNRAPVLPQVVSSAGELYTNKLINSFAFNAIIRQALCHILNGYCHCGEFIIGCLSPIYHVSNFEEVNGP